MIFVWRFANSRVFSRCEESWARERIYGHWAEEVSITKAQFNRMHHFLKASNKRGMSSMLPSAEPPTESKPDRPLLDLLLVTHRHLKTHAPATDDAMKASHLQRHASTIPSITKSPCPIVSFIVPVSPEISNPCDSRACCQFQTNTCCAMFFLYVSLVRCFRSTSKYQSFWYTDSTIKSIKSIKASSGVPCFV